MHTFALRLALGTVSMVALSGCSPGPQPPDGDSGALLEARQAEFASALEALDAPRLSALFAEDGVVHVAGFEAVEGREAVAGFYGRVFGFMDGSRVLPGPVRISESGDMAYATGATANEFRGPDGPVRYEGKYLVVWRQVDGDWRIGAYSLTGNDGGARP
jgi:ketosteroid isomerase-like protein